MKIDKTGYYLKTFDRDVFLTKDQREALVRAMDNDAKYVEINDSLIMLNQVKEIMPAGEYEKIPDGGRYCPRHKNNLIAKGKSCGYCG